MTGARSAWLGSRSRFRPRPVKPGHGPWPAAPPAPHSSRSLRVKASNCGRAPTFDRYGRTLAHVHVANEGRGRSVAHEMLALGYARVAALVGDRACAAEFLARERAARQAKLGLWGEPYYAIVGAESGAALLAERGHFTVVEGKVLSVRESGGTIYMNFGRRWSEALTVTVPKRQERAFSAAGLAPRALESRRVRVRGWVEERNGPRIEAASPEQIEIADRN
jgi:micrococcal nuclease